jgi:hypothetical protein
MQRPSHLKWADQEEQKERETERKREPKTQERGEREREKQTSRRRIPHGPTHEPLNPESPSTR